MSARAPTRISLDRETAPDRTPGGQRCAATGALPDGANHAAAHGGNIFQAAREWRCDWREILDFSANINPLGVSPAVREALEQSIARIAHYPENGSPALRDAVARAWRIGPGNVLAGNGATELIYFLVRVLRPKKAHLVVPTFSEYPRALAGCELSFTACEPASYQLDWPKLAADVAGARPDWLLLTHPNNPTGSAIDPARFLHWFDEQRPAETMVLLDESFIDFAPELSVAREVARRRKLLVVRSLTKFYALPGLRLGCLMAHSEEIQALDELREPWQVNVLAEQAALAALADGDYRRRTLQLIAEERHWLFERLRRLPGVRPFPSAANFLFAHCDRPVPKLQSFLEGRKILVRDCSGTPGIPCQAFRIAVRTREENEILAAALEKFFGR